MENIFPFVRYVHYIEMIPAYTTHLQIAYDHRIFYCVNGKYAISVGNTCYTLNENSLVFVPSGVPYHLHRPDTAITLVGINFDFSQANSELTMPIAPAFEEKNYNPAQLLERCNFTDIQQFNAPFILHNQHCLFTYVRQMLDEYDTKRLFYAQQNSALLKQMLTSMGRTLMTGFSHMPKNTVDTVIAYIQANYMRRISNADIGRELNFHPNYLNRLMLLHTGRSLHQYLLGYRLTKALDLLQSTPMTVTEIAHETGFTDVQQFCKFFQAQTGCTPGSFR